MVENVPKISSTSNFLPGITYDILMILINFVKQTFYIGNCITSPITKKKHIMYKIQTEYKML